MNLIEWDRQIETIDGNICVSLTRVTSNDVDYGNLVTDLLDDVQYSCDAYGNRLTVDGGSEPFIQNVPVALRLYGNQNGTWATFRFEDCTKVIELTQRDLDRLMRPIDG